MEKKEGKSKSVRTTRSVFANKMATSEAVSSGRNNFDADQIISTADRIVTSKLLEHIKKLCLRIPLSNFHYKDDLEKLSDAFSEHKIDSLPLKVKLEKLLMDVARYNSKMSTLTATEVNYHRRLAENKSRLDRASDLEAAYECQYESLHESLATLAKRRENLRREQEQVEEGMLKLRVSISQCQVKMDDHQIMIDRLLKQKAEFLNTPVLDSEEAKALEQLKESLDSQCKSFQDFTL